MLGHKPTLTFMEDAKVKFWRGLLKSLFKLYITNMKNHISLFRFRLAWGWIILAFLACLHANLFSFLMLCLVWIKDKLRKKNNHFSCHMRNEVNKKLQCGEKIRTSQVEHKCFKQPKERPSMQNKKFTKISTCRLEELKEY